MHRLLNDIAARCPGGKLPDTYKVFDSETSGLDKYKDRMLQVGVAIVKDRCLVTSYSQIIDRGDLPIHPKAEAVHKINRDRMTKEGVAADLFMPQLIDQFIEWQKEGFMFAGHNIMAFDAGFLELEAKLLGKNFRFGDNDVIDAGMLVKAAQLGSFMRPSESLRDFYVRTSEVFAKGIFWSLDRHCMKTYGLEKRSGIGASQAHDAEVDCKLTSALLETLKDMHAGKEGEVSSNS